MSDLLDRYVIDSKWREAWITLATRHKGLQSKQDYLDFRANLANERIAKLMDEYDRRMRIKNLDFCI